MKLLQAFGQFAGQAAALDEGSMVFLQRVTATGTTSVNFDNVFDSTYDVYRIIPRLTYSTTLANVNTRMRVGGSDDTGANYDEQIVVSYGSSNSLARLSNQTSARSLTVDDEGATTGVIDIYSPADTIATVWVSTWGDRDATGRLLHIASFVKTATAYDGITFFTSGNMTGTFDCYGMQVA